MKKIVVACGGVGLAFGLLAFSLGPDYVGDDEVAGPPRSLPVAYDMAMRLLGPLTNEFSCIRAERGFPVGPVERWAFVFRSTNSNYKTVTVPVQPIQEVVDREPKRPFRWREPATISDGEKP